MRPDRGYAARGLRPALQLRQADGTLIDATPSPVGSGRGAGSRVGRRAVLAGGAVAAALIAGGLSFLASGSPDGLERVAESEGFADSARDHAFGGFALAEYGEIGGVPVGLAGLLGVVVTVIVGVTVFRLVRRRSDREENVAA